MRGTRGGAAPFPLISLSPWVPFSLSHWIWITLLSPSLSWTSHSLSPSLSLSLSCIVTLSFSFGPATSVGLEAVLFFVGKTLEPATPFGLGPRSSPLARLRAGTLLLDWGRTSLRRAQQGILSASDFPRQDYPNADLTPRLGNPLTRSARFFIDATQNPRPRPRFPRALI